MSALENLVGELEQDRLLDEPHCLRERLEALDRLESHRPAAAAGSIPSDLDRRARAIHTRLETANRRLYQAIRAQIRGGARPGEEAGPWRPPPLLSSFQPPPALRPAAGESYDCLDELIHGIFQFPDPGPPRVRLRNEMVFYQPTPARHIFDLMGAMGLTERDVLVDLGSGLGHVALLASVSTGALSFGLELEPAYVEGARRAARALDLRRVTFLEQDARAADLSRGTAFYLYTPFTGSILRAVLDSLRSQAAARTIRVGAFGPCTAVLAGESWLDPLTPLETGRIAVFSSRN